LVVCISVVRALSGVWSFSIVGTGGAIAQPTWAVAPALVLKNF
jgi:hypothetical protein